MAPEITPMDLKQIRPARILLLLLPLWLSVQCACPLAASQNQKQPLWWEIGLAITVDGEYKTQEGESRHSGKYLVDILWTGTMERDAEDYRLFHANSKNLRWEAQEITDSLESAKTLTTEDFDVCPELRMQYILKKEGLLHFAFWVVGFSVPRDTSVHKYYVALPESEEHHQNISDIDYGSQITQGSNRVCFDERDLLKPALEKKFNWRWRRQEWLLKNKRTVFFSNRHSARVKITVTPHYEY